jgi:hypothetical protein
MGQGFFADEQEMDRAPRLLGSPSAISVAKAVLTGNRSNCFEVLAIDRDVDIRS